MENNGVSSKDITESVSMKPIGQVLQIPELTERALRIWPVHEERELQEKLFFRNLIEKIVDSYEKSVSKLRSENIDEILNYCVYLSQYRVSTIVSELERTIRFKSVGLSASAGKLHTDVLLLNSWLSSLFY